MIKVHQHALINQMLYRKKKKNLLPNDVLVRPTEKVERMIFYEKLCKVDPLQFRMMYTLTFMSKNYCKLFQLKKMQLIALVPPCHSPHKLGYSAHLSV